MTTIKSHTDLSQSKKLAKILPLESADMYYYTINGDLYKTPNVIESEDDLYVDEKSIPCWSLTALLDIIPKRIKEYNVLRIDISENDTSIWYDEIGYGVNNNLPDITVDNPVDACVAMVEKLKELNLL